LIHSILSHWSVRRHV